MADTTLALSLLKDLVHIRIGERNMAFAQKLRATLEESAHRNVARGGPMITLVSNIATEEAEQRVQIAHDTIVGILPKTTFAFADEAIVGLFNSIDFDAQNADLQRAVEYAHRISGMTSDPSSRASVKIVTERSRDKYRLQLQIIAMAPQRHEVQISVGNANMIQTGGEAHVTQNQAESAASSALEAEGVRREFLSRCKSLKKMIDALDDPHAGVKWWRDQANAFLTKVQSLNIGRFLTDAQCDAIHEIEQCLHLAFDQARIEDEVQEAKKAAGYQPDGTFVVVRFSMSDDERTELRRNHFTATSKSVEDAIALLEESSSKSA